MLFREKDVGSVFDFCILLTNFYHFNVYRCEWPRGECSLLRTVAIIIYNLTIAMSRPVVGLSPSINQFSAM